MGIGNAEGHNLAGLVTDESGKKKILTKRKLNDAEDYVLGEFNTTEVGKVRTLVQHTAQALELALEKGCAAAQNRYNTK